MPRAPLYGEPQVQQSPLRIPRQSFQLAGSFGEGITKGLSDLEAAAAKIQEDNDRNVVKERLADYRRFSSQRGYQDKDAYFNRQGRHAHDTLGEARKELEDYRKKLMNDLSPRQQRAFDLASQPYLDRDFEAYSRHAFAGFKKWEAEQTAAHLALTQEDVVKFATNPAEHARAVQQIKALIGVQANEQGWSDEVHEAKELAALTAAHKSAVEFLQATSPSAARAYYRKHKEEIAASARAPMEKAMSAAADGAWVLSQADQIEAAGVSLMEQFEMAETAAKGDMKRLRALRAEINFRDGLRVTAENRFKVEAYGHAYEALSGGMTIEQYKRENPEEWAALTPPQKRTLEGDADPERETDLDHYSAILDLMNDPGGREKALAYYEQHADQFSDSDAQAILRAVHADEKRATDPALYDEIKRRIDGGEINTARRMILENSGRLTAKDQKKLLDAAYKDTMPRTDLSVYFEIRGLIADGMLQEASAAIAANRQRLSDTDAKKFVDLIYEQRNPQNITPPGRAQSDLAAFDDWFLGLQGKRPKSGQKLREWAVRRRVVLGMYTDKIAEWLEANKQYKSITPEARTKILDDLVFAHRKTGFWPWFYGDRAGGFPDIPTDDLTAIIQVLREKGLPVTPENIVDMYEAGK